VPPFPIALECINGDIIVIASKGNDLNLGFAKKLVQQNSGVSAYPRREDQGRLHYRGSAGRHHGGFGNVAEQPLAARFSKEHGQDG